MRGWRACGGTPRCAGGSRLGQRALRRLSGGFKEWRLSGGSRERGEVVRRGSIAVGSREGKKKKGTWKMWQQSSTGFLIRDYSSAECKSVTLSRYVAYTYDQIHIMIRTWLDSSWLDTSSKGSRFQLLAL